MTTHTTDTPHKAKRWLRQAALPILVLIIGAAIAVVVFKMAPEAKRKPPPRQARLVNVQPVRRSRETVVVHAMGVVRPARESKIQPRVSGQIVSVSETFMPGGRFAEGEILVELDRTDFDLAMRQRDTEVINALSEQALELGRQAVARREFELLGEDVRDEDQDLVLRRPQRNKVDAAVQTSEAAKEQARLNLDRTAVRAPFNAVIRDRFANIGMSVTPATPLATLVGTDTYWVEASVPVSQLRWIRFPNDPDEAGSAGRIYNDTAWGPGVYRNGTVVRLLSDLESDGRMARVLIAVDDPLALTPDRAGEPALLLNDYLRVEIDGIELEDVTPVDRSLVHDGDMVWVMNDDNRLEIRKATIVYRGLARVLVQQGLNDGERLVVTTLSTPVDGMPLRTPDMAAAEPKQP